MLWTYPVYCPWGKGLRRLFQNGKIRVGLRKLIRNTLDSQYAPGAFLKSCGNSQLGIMEALAAMMSDRQIVCMSCGSEFTFSADEQEFYETKGFQEPKKCKPCRAAAKQNRGGGGGRGGYGGGRPQRQMYDAVCASCGVQTQVPFMPSGTKPVYCRDCFQGSSQRFG